MAFGYRPDLSDILENSHEDSSSNVSEMTHLSLSSDDSDDTLTFANSSKMATTQAHFLPIQKAKWSSCSDVVSCGTSVEAKKTPDNFLDVNVETAADESSLSISKAKWISDSDVSSNAGTPLNAKKMLDESQKVKVQVFDEAPDIVASAHSHANLDNNENIVNGCRSEISFGSSTSEGTRFLTWAEQFKEKVKLEYPDPVYQPDFAKYSYGDVDALIGVSSEQSDSLGSSHPPDFNMTADEKIQVGVYDPSVKVLRSGSHYVSTESLVCNPRFDEDDISVCDISFTSNISNDFEDCSLKFEEQYVDPDAEYQSVKCPTDGL